ncbi:hypothetical protein B0H15DRAFT_955494 [Mycena belliarum]|uniref:Uncharacterized protein n=1 Tax=Mycena belliarum TaxID=1033014 RepID=A0AAD6TT00_9AGAR|nr:hypothetical protein B0H15DRAFT_955494 [Mycena belliae]
MQRTLRERRGFTLSLSFAHAAPNIPARGHTGPNAGNLPRRKRRVVPLDVPEPVDMRNRSAAPSMIEERLVFIASLRPGIGQELRTGARRRSGISKEEGIQLLKGMIAQAPGATAT